MPRAPRASTRRLRQIARLRAGGAVWPTVAEQLGLSPETCERLVDEHADTYRPLFRQELRWRLLETLAEAVAVLRRGLRRDEFKEQRDAVLGVLKLQQVLAGRRTAGKQPAPSAMTQESEHIVAYLDGISDEESQELLAQGWEQLQPVEPHDTSS